MFSTFSATSLSWRDTRTVTVFACSWALGETRNFGGVAKGKLPSCRRALVSVLVMSVGVTYSPVKILSGAPFIHSSYCHRSATALALLTMLVSGMMALSMMCSYFVRSCAVQEGVAMTIGVLLLPEGIIPCAPMCFGASGSAFSKLSLMFFSVSPGLMLSKEIGGSAKMTRRLG
jgi:hypothetical protein